jgi:prevent-host-death family protein
MSTWQLQDAKARFSELVDKVKESGPQIVTRRGVEEAVIMSMDEWRRLQQASRPNIKELLLSGPKFDLKLPKRGKWKLRPPIDFSGPEYK